MTPTQRTLALCRKHVVAKLLGTAVYYPYQLVDPYRT